MAKGLVGVGLSLLSVLFLFGLMGCGGGGGAAGNVNGKVTYKGVPVTGGMITFHLDGGKAFSAPLDGAGTYGTQVIATGKAKVTVETESIRPTGGEEAAKIELKGGGAASTTYMKIPAKFAEPTTTTLSTELKSGTQTKNFELTD